jgi:hypothetical protein
MGAGNLKPHDLPTCNISPINEKVARTNSVVRERSIVPNELILRVDEPNKNLYFNPDEKKHGDITVTKIKLFKDLPSEDLLKETYVKIEIPIDKKGNYRIRYIQVKLFNEGKNKVNPVIDVDFLTTKIKEVIEIGKKRVHEVILNHKEEEYHIKKNIENIQRTLQCFFKKSCLFGYNPLYFNILRYLKYPTEVEKQKKPNNTSGGNHRSQKRNRINRNKKSKGKQTKKRI